MPVEIVVMCLIFLFAGVLQGTSGFGFGLVAVGLLAQIWPDPKTGAVLPVLPALAICAYAFYRHRAHLSWPRVIPFIAATLVGIPLGVWALKSIDLLTMRLAIGGLLILSSVYGWLPLIGRYRWHRYYLGLPLGVAAGFLGGAFNTSGPPAIAFFSNQRLGRHAVVASLQATFTITTAIRLVCLISADMMPPRVAALSALGIVAAIAGAMLGMRLLHAISDRTAAHGMRGLQLALGVLFLAQAGGILVSAPVAPPAPVGVARP